MHFKDRKLRREVIRFAESIKWYSPYAVTLTFKVGIWSPDGCWIKCTRREAEQNVRHWLNVISRQLYGRPGRRGSLKIKCLSVIEETASQRLHYHLILDKPPSWLGADFHNLLRAKWRNTHWGGPEIDIQPCDLGWLKYIAKGRTKPEYDLSIDWINSHNG